VGHAARETGSFVDPVLADRHSDLVFSARLRTGARSRAYVIAEHQSTGDRSMPLRTLTYQVRIWNRFRKQYRTARLPPILVVVVSHVRAAGSWHAHSSSYSTRPWRRIASWLSGCRTRL